MIKNNSKEMKKIVTKDIKTVYFPPSVLYKQTFIEESGMWHILWMGPNFKKSTGFDYADFKNDRKLWVMRLHPRDKKKTLEKLVKLENGAIQSVELTYRWLHNDETYHWFIDCATLLKDEYSGASEIIGCWVDISVHTNAVRTIEENEEHYKKIVELSPHALFVHNEGAFRFLNIAAVRLFGGNCPEDIIGKPLLNFIHSDYHEQIRQQISTAANDEVATPLIAYRIITLAGEVRDVEIASSPFIYQGKRSVQGVIVDVTKLKIIEDTNRTNTEELEHLNQILMRRESKHVLRGDNISASSFNQERGILFVGTHEINIHKFSRQYNLLRIIFRNAETESKDWQFSEISELMDIEAQFDWKKIYNIADAIRKNIAMETGIRDFFILTTQSLKINSLYLEKS